MADSDEKKTKAELNISPYAEMDRKTADWVKSISALGRDVVEAEERLKTGMAELKKTYLSAEKKGKFAGAAREFGVDFLSDLGADNVRSIKSLNSDYASFKGKLDRLEKKFNTSSSMIHNLATEQGKLQKRIDAKIVKEAADRDYTSKRLPKLQAQNKKLKAQITTAITDIGKKEKDIADVRAREKEYKATLRLTNEKKSKWVSAVQTGAALPELVLAAKFTEWEKIEQIMVRVDSVLVEVDNVLAEEV